MANTNAMSVDIESLSTRHDAAILSIGCALFDPRDEIGAIKDTFYVAISAQSNQAEGRHISADTVMWWLGPSVTQAARDALSIDATNLRDALIKFKVWVSKHQPETVYANSPSFDCVIIKDAMDHLGIHVPWRYFQERCVRTAKELATDDEGKVPDFQGDGVAHSALDDAIKQAMAIQYVFAKLRA